MNKIEKALRKIAREVLLKWRCEIRYIAERKIFPKIKNKKVLLVGCAHYTADYPKRLKNNDLWTIDVNPMMAKFGGKKHIINSIANIDKYFKEDFFDVIILGGVFGFGLNDAKEAEKTMKNCAKVLKKNGLIVIWWNNVPPYDKINPRKLKNFNLFNTRSFNNYPSGYNARDNIIIEFLTKKL